MRVQLLSLPVDLLSRHETVERALVAMRRGGRCQHVALNVAKLVKARRDPDLDRDIRESDIVGIDGAGIVLALRVKGHGRPERVAGIDLFEDLVAACADEGLRVFLLGARPDVVEEASQRLRERHPALQVAGFHHGYFGPEGEDDVCRRIRASGAHALFVALPTPAKERFMHRRRDDLGVPFVMGVGGSFDVVAGRVRRAPVLVQKLCGEWLFRLLQEPRRLAGRYLQTNAVFAGLIIADALGLLDRVSVERRKI